MDGRTGNQNARKRHWTTAVEAAVLVEDPASKRRKLDAIAHRLVKLTESDNEAVALAAMKELGDRLDGKPKQQTEISGVDGAPLAVTWKQDAG